MTAVSFENDIHGRLIAGDCPLWLYFNRESGMFMGKADHLGFLVGYIPSEDDPEVISRLVFVNCSSHYAEAEIIAGKDGIYKVPRYYNSHIVGGDSAFMCSNLDFRNIADVEKFCNCGHIRKVSREPFSFDDKTLLLGVKQAVLDSVANSNKVKDSITFTVDRIAWQ
jgi:hypothetical protein